MLLSYLTYLVYQKIFICSSFVTLVFSIILFHLFYSTTIQINLMLGLGPINNLCSLLIFINILMYFDVTRLPLYIPISFTNTFLLSLFICFQHQSLAPSLASTVQYLLFRGLDSNQLLYPFEIKHSWTFLIFYFSMWTLGCQLCAIKIKLI